MTCGYDRDYRCNNGYDYYYNDCCNAGMTTFWSIFLWISMALCLCACCAMMMAAMRRRRMQQMMMAHQRNGMAVGGDGGQFMSGGRQGGGDWSTMNN